MRVLAHAGFVSALVATALALGTPAAVASYEETHITGDDARVTVDAAGNARVQHVLTWRLVAGKPKGFDFTGIEPLARPDPAATLEAEDGRILPAVVEAVLGHGLHVTVTDPRALRHNETYRVTLAYDVSLDGAGELVREASTYRILWRSPPPVEGLDGAKVTFVLPGALEPPGALVGEGGMRDDGVAATLMRAPDHDEVELVRPHIGRGEEVVWAVHVDAKAFDAKKGPARPPPPLSPRREASTGLGALAYAVAALLGIAFAAGVRWKHGRFARRLAAADRSDGPRALVPLRARERSALAGAAVFVGLTLELGDQPLAGATLLALAMALGVVRPSRAGAAPRGPGRWLVLRPAEAFARRAPSGLALEVTVVAAVGLAALLVASLVLAEGHPDVPRILWLDLLVLTPLLATGLGVPVPSDRVGRRGPWLARLFRRLQKHKGLRVSPWARLSNGQAEPDEVRLLALPRAPMPGLSAIEVGLAWGHGGASGFATPEVLVRVEEATFASARLAALVKEVVPVPGRKPEERVYRLAPDLPTAKATAALVLGLAGNLEDRRVADVADVEGSRAERRVPLVPEAESASSVPLPVLG